MQKQQTLVAVRAPSGVTKIPLKGNVNDAPLKRVNTHGVLGRPQTTPQMRPMVYTHEYRLRWHNYIHSLPRIPRIKVLACGTGFDAKMIK